MKNLRQSLSKFWNHNPQSLHWANLAMLCLLATFALALITQGCGTTAPQLTREQKLYSDATNVVSTFSQIGTVLPPPFCSIFEGGTALATAILAAWNAWQHKQIKALQNGGSNSALASATATGSPPQGPAA